jgi:hypothetical protein
MKGPWGNSGRALGVGAFWSWLALLGVAGLCLPSIYGADIAKLKTPSRAELEKSLEGGIQFLVTSQNKDGSWGTARRTKELNIFAPVPGAHHAFRSGTTALCVEALIETQAAAGTNRAGHERLEAALQRGEDWLLENLPKLRRANSIAIYNVWGHGYGIEALTDMWHRTKDPARKRKILEVIEGQVDLLRRYESVDGGWSYYDFRIGAKQPATDPASFTTGTILLALRDAMDIGVEVPTNLIARAVRAINRQRKNDNTYVYDEPLKMRPQTLINRAPGSLGRSQVCNLALRQFGDMTITDAVLTNWLGKLIVRNEWLGFGRKRPVPHESWFQVAGYFYYYGHYYAARCTDQLPTAVARPYRNWLAAILVPLQEKDGSWWDFPLYDYHQPYGTAFALMTLSRCREER